MIYPSEVYLASSAQVFPPSQRLTPHLGVSSMSRFELESPCAADPLVVLAATVRRWDLFVSDPQPEVRLQAACPFLWLKYASWASGGMSLEAHYVCLLRHRGVLMNNLCPRSSLPSL